MKNYEFICPSCGTRHLFRNYYGGGVICRNCSMPFDAEKKKSISANPSPSIPEVIGKDPEKRISINQLNITTGHSINLNQNVSVGRPGMNLGQLTVLWHAVIIVVTACFLSRDSFLAVVGVCIFASALIYTLKPHPGVEKKKMLKTVVAPWAILACVVVLISYGNDCSVPVSHVTTDGQMTLLTDPFTRVATLTGTLTNKGRFRIKQVTCRITAQNYLGKVDLTRIGWCSIPSDESAAFTIFEDSEGADIAALRKLVAAGAAVSFKLTGARGTLLPWDQ